MPVSDQTSFSSLLLVLYQPHKSLGIINCFAQELQSWAQMQTEKCGRSLASLFNHPALAAEWVKSNDRIKVQVWRRARKLR